MRTSVSTEPGGDEVLKALLEPEMAAVFDPLPALSIDDLPTVRAALVAAPAAPEHPEVTRQDRRVPGLPGQPDVLVRVYEPAARPAVALPALFWVHGGGYVMGHVGRDDALLQSIVVATGCVVVSVEWRQAPEDPYPAGLDDAEAGYRWLIREAAELGVDSTAVVLGGQSSGGGTATALALRLRDSGDLAAVPLLLLVFPMLDDRGMTGSAERTVDRRLWNRRVNSDAWRAYLGETAGDPPEYAAPARATDLSAFPPTWIAVGDLDLFVDEDIRFAQALMAASVSTELHVYSGAIHGFFSRLPGTPQADRFEGDLHHALQRAFDGAWPQGGRAAGRSGR
jgi:acetyl esterase/lipase